MILPFLAVITAIYLMVKRNYSYTVSIVLAIVALLTITLALNHNYLLIIASIFEGGFGKVVSSINIDYFIEGIPGTYSLKAAVTLKFFFTFATAIFVFPLLIIRGKRESLLYTSFLLVAIFTVLFWYIFPTKETIRMIASILGGPILFLWGDFVKLPMLLMISYSVMLALALDEISERYFLRLNFNFRRNIRRSIIRIIRIILLLSLLTSPIFAWGFLPSSLLLYSPFDVRNYIDGPDLSRYQVPSVYEHVRDWLMEHGWNQTSFRIAWLPLDPVRTVFTYIPNTFFSTEKINELVFGSLVYGGTNFGDLVGSFGVKYVIVNLAQQEPVEWHQGRPRLLGWGLKWYPIGDPNEFVKLLSRQKNLKLVENNTDFVVFENLAFVPKISIPYAKGLVLYMPFDEGAGSIVIDSSGNGNNGTIHGATWTDGKYGQGLYFQNSSTQYVTVPDSSSLNSHFLTISAWVKFDSIPEFATEQVVVQKWNRFCMEIYFNPERGTGAKFRGFIWVGGRVYHLDGAPYNLQPNTWYLLTMTYDGASLMGYVNGIPVQSVNVSGFLDPSTDDVFIGGNGGPNPVGITVDDVRIYNTSLSAFHINSIYQNILSHSRVSINSLKATGPVSYQVNVTSEAPFFLVFLESYDPHWVVRVNNRSIASFRALGWANGFYVNATGDVTLEITYDRQTLWQSTLIMSMLSWATLIAIVITKPLFVASVRLKKLIKRNRI
jgi:hypothetical protein